MKTKSANAGGEYAGGGRLFLRSSPFRCGFILRRACVALLVWGTVSGAALAETRRVVLLYDERTDLPGLAAIDASFAKALTAGSPDHFELYRESMDLSRFDSDTYRRYLRDHLQTKYSGRRVDVVVAVMEPALDFLLEHRAVLFPDTPIVFCGIERGRFGEGPLPSRVTGVLLKREFAPTLELALHLHPETKRVVVVAGASAFDAALVAQAREEFRGFENRLRFTWLTELPLAEVLTKLSRLPPDTIVLYTTLFRDGAGASFVPHEVAGKISAAANAPVYGFLDQYLGRGIVGGRLYSVATQGEEAARLTLRILAGTPPAELTPVAPVATAALFDWRQLQRWKISKNRLPPGSEVRFHTPTLWEQYKWRLIGIHLLVLVEAALIGLLVRSRRRVTQLARELKKNEKRLTLAATAGDLGLWFWNLQSNALWATERARKMFGFAPESELTYEMFYARVHPEDRRSVDAGMANAISGKGNYGAEYRICLPGGAEKWIAVRGEVAFEDGGRPVSMTGIVSDITKRRRDTMELLRHRQELAHISRISVLGELSASLAHELNQPLTAILSNAQAAQRFLNASAPDLDELRDILRDIVQDDARAGEVIRRMRALVKKTPPDLQPVDLAGLIRDVVRLVHSDALIRNVHVALELAPLLPPARGDKVQLQQVVLNLLLNSFDAMKDNREPDRSVTVRLSSSADGTFQVAVRDVGCGLKREQLDKLFQPFQTTKPNGLGLGLSISRSIIQAHGGRLWAENNTDKGATFYFALPLMGEESVEDRGTRLAAA